ncbi:ThiF family adenylyltransferase [Brevibacillus laterosporus]|nr:ThiF family adenylyltransferase [Brevibacillus laterosporus]MED2002183.1 ThiF family adenylyltransferase [Brevibacillus laterosporus]MED4765524.1 ThiF family adenylyltransferase [Brevibacillus laterosporus]
MDENQYYWEMVKKNIGVYSREEQERLRNAKVIIFGLGGGGYEVILCARMGLGHITGVDPDEFEVSNINRQMLSFVSRIGSNKAETAAELLQDINPSINIRVTQDFVTEQNAIDLLSNTDVIVDATDDLVARVIIHRARLH